MEEILDGTPMGTCERCGGQMVIRTNKTNGSRFLGCENYPKCWQTKELPLSVIKRLRGDPQLPGFEVT